EMVGFPFGTVIQAKPEAGANRDRSSDGSAGRDPYRRKARHQPTRPRWPDGRGREQALKRARRSPKQTGPGDEPAYYPRTHDIERGTDQRPQELPSRAGQLGDRARA